MPTHTQNYAGPLAHASSLFFIRQLQPLLWSHPSGVIVLVACFVDLRLMKVATSAPAISSLSVCNHKLFLLFHFFEQTVYWEEHTCVCHLPPLSFYLPRWYCTLGIIDLLA